MLKLENCQVTKNVKTIRADKTEYHAVQVAASDRPERTTTKAMQGHFLRAGVTSKYIVKEFPVTPDAHIPIGMCKLEKYLMFPRSLFLVYHRNDFIRTTLRARTICGRDRKLVRPLYFLH